VIAYPIGSKRKLAAQKFWSKIPIALKSCFFETDD
jgi:hypothetical protein